jgi:hydrogenase maturation protease
MSNRLLILGYGNPGRLDDGLGPACIEALRKLDLPGVTLESDYQLTVEDAALAAEHEVAVFIDATVAGLEPFEFLEVQPAETLSFSSHDVEPGAVVTLAQSLFGARLQAFTLAIRGYRFNDFGEHLSRQALTNLAAAVEFLTPLAQSGGLGSANTEGAAFIERGYNKPV